VRIIAVADSHLAPHAHAFNDNWRAVRRYVDQARADLTVHLGDITVDGARDPGQFDHARAVTAGWPTPVRFLPGNHDVGNNPPGPGLIAAEPFCPPSLDAYRRAFGADYWALEHDDWYLLGLDAQLLGSETRDEADQWDWLASRVATSAGRPTVLFLHKPLFQTSAADAAPHHRYVPLAPRRQLLDLLAVVRLRLVVSGHTHQYRDRAIDGVRHLWLPSTAFFLPDEVQERIGEKITGLAEIELTTDRASVHLVCPDGVQRHDGLDQPVYPKLAAARARIRSNVEAGAVATTSDSPGHRRSAMRRLGSWLFTASTAIALGMLRDAGLGVAARLAGGD
jgi:3',5'-cyclic AMP phosphodiesterase CpdA